MKVQQDWNTECKGERGNDEIQQIFAVQCSTRLGFTLNLKNMTIN